MNSHHYPVVCFGEVLWDILPTGKEPGGAPMNVAYHINKHHIHTTLITCIGNDEEGNQIKELFQNRNISTDFFETDNLHETGKVYATQLAGNEMSYEIVQPVAWDFISYDEKLKTLVDAAGYFVFGSLACRAEVSRNTLLRLLQTPATKVFDINLRPPHYTKETLTALLSKADILKMNEHELEVIGGWFAGERNREELIRYIADYFNIHTVIVTLSADGALLFKDEQFYYHAGYRVKVTDTIGSGDSCLAALLAAFIKGKKNEEALDAACRLGAFIASKKGGCPEYSIEEVKNASR